jgi:hypothetical protein
MTNCPSCSRQLTSPFCPACEENLLSPYGKDVRGQVFEVIVRQGLAGAPWREIFQGPMMVNRISEASVAYEIKRRQDHLRGGDSSGGNTQPSGVPRMPKTPDGSAGVSLFLPECKDMDDNADTIP